LLYGIINVIGVECLLSNPSFKETRQKIFIMCAKFLLDGNNETRYLIYVSHINMKAFYLIASTNKIISFFFFSRFININDKYTYEEFVFTI